MGANALPITDWPWTERSAHRWVGNTCWGDAKNQGRQQIRLFAEITVRRKGRRCYGEWYRREAKLNQLGIQRVTCGLPITEFAHKAGNGRFPLPAAIGIVRSAKPSLPRSGWPTARPNSCRFPTSMSY